MVSAVAVQECAFGHPGGTGANVVEVEKKVFLTEMQQKALQATLPGGKEKAFWDVYYDGPKMQLTKKDWWLRQRDSAWELKIPINFGQGLNSFQSYEEVVDIPDILSRLIEDGMFGPGAEEAVITNGSVPPECLKPILAAQGIEPFAKLHTRRTSIAATCPGRDGAPPLIVDLDTVMFDRAYAEGTGGLAEGEDASEGRPYRIAEVEMMVPKGKEEEAGATCEAFLAAHGLEGAPRAYSKLLEYLMRFRPAHLDVLCAAGVATRAQLEQLKAEAVAAEEALLN